MQAAVSVSTHNAAALDGEAMTDSAAQWVNADVSRESRRPLKLAYEFLQRRGTLP